jgi:hypothetical protein
MAVAGIVPDVFVPLEEHGNESTVYFITIWNRG